MISASYTFPICKSFDNFHRKRNLLAGANLKATVFSDDSVMGLASANPEPRRNEVLSGTLSSNSIIGTSLRVSGNAVIGGTFQAAAFAGGALMTATISGSIGNFSTLTSSSADFFQRFECRRHCD